MVEFNRFLEMSRLDHFENLNGGAVYGAIVLAEKPRRTTAQPEFSGPRDSFRRPGKPFIPQSKSNGRGICHMDKKRKPGVLETIIRLTPKRAGLARKDETVFPSARILIQALQLITNQTQSRYLGLP